MTPATGNDHFNCYIPSYHGDDIEPVFKETMQSLVGQLKEPSLMHKFLEKSFELVQMWDAWGVNMRPTGDWECKGPPLPGKPRAFLKYDGSDQKKVLVREAKAVGVKFYNHHPVVELARVGGRIWVTAGNAATANTAAHLVVKDTTSHGLPVGSFVGTEITGDTVALTNVQWVTAASAGSLGLLEII